MLRATLWTLGTVFGLLMAFGAAAAVELARIADDLRDANTLIERAGTALESGQLTDAQASLDEALVLLVRANSSLHSNAWIDLVTWLPVARQNTSSLEDSIAMALTLVNGGSRILGVAAPLQADDGSLEIPLRRGAVPLGPVRDAEIEAGNLAVLLPGPAERPADDLLLGPVADLQQRVFDESVVRREQLVGLANGLGLVSELSGGEGSRRYLIAVANTAEMRGTGGMILSYGILGSANGDFELGNFGNIDELALPAPIDPDAVGLPEDYLARWDGLDPTFLWRNANLMPDFDIAADVMGEMFTTATGLEVNGVIQIDPSGLAAILGGIGPVEVEGVGTVTADNVVALTLNEAYTLFPDRDQRQEVLADVAEEVFERLVEGEYDSLRTLGEELLGAAVERHILFHPENPSAQDHVRFFEADGALPPAETQDYALLSVQNFSANKLDYYLDTSLSLTGARPVGEAGSLTAQITLHNTAPADGESSYVFGPNVPGQEAGLYRTIVSLYLPTGTNLESYSGTELGERPVIDTEAGRTLVAYAVDLPAGASSTVTLELTLPPRPPVLYALSLVPVPRVRPTQVEVSIDAGDGLAVIQGSRPLTQAVVLFAAPAEGER